MSLTIKTDSKYKPFVYRSEVPAKILAGQFNHLSEDDASDGFFCYRGAWYHLSAFMRSDSADAFTEGGKGAWDGYAADSYFSGVLIRVSRDGETYCVGTYLS